MAKTASSGNREHDVIVVGGGISGLAAADLAAESGAHVVLLEAGDRLGGRIDTVKTEDGAIFEFGPSYIATTQHHMFSLVRRYGLSTSAIQLPYDKLSIVRGGMMLPDHNGALKEVCLPQHFRGTSYPYDPEVARAVLDIDRLSMRVSANLAEPWRLEPELAALDSMTVQQWAEANLNYANYTQSVEMMHLLLSVFVRSILSVSWDEISMLFFLYYVARCGGFRYMTDSVDYGPDSIRVVEGYGTIIEQLLADYTKRGGEVHTGAKVTRVVDDGAGVTVTASEDGKERCYRAKHAIVALPPPVCRGIEFSPPVSEDRRRICEAMHMGRTIKGYVRYADDWWSRLAGVPEEAPPEQNVLACTLRDARTPANAGGAAPAAAEASPVGPPTGHTGYSISGCGTVVWTMNASEGEHHALLFFITGRQADEWGAKSEQERATEVKRTIADIFFMSAPDPGLGEYLERNWQITWAGGGPTGVLGPGMLSAWHALRRPHGRVHWAGTEVAIRWGGYMEGGIDAGLRAARAVLAAQRIPLAMDSKWDSPLGSVAEP